MQARTRVKICGLKNQENIRAAVEAGADAIGFVFFPGSKRALTIEQACELRKDVPPFVTLTALFVNAAADEVNAVIDRVRPDLLQFHGDETPAYCEQFRRPYIRGFRVGGPGMQTPDEVLATCQRYLSASAWLVDSYSSGYGGSGQMLDTRLLARLHDAAERRPLILAGGLTAQSVAESIRAVRPYAVDVSSGVETAPGIKSAEKIVRFLEAVAAP
ncbi:phosphoribosylanthranilate isomerase [Parapusillimonas sp. SGNA-6]|nr:phosphoribosylanthranilate isomerase [Parapusillimonas sp. SGNA-6]